jgi:ATP-dependent RNA helicase DDX21
MLDMGFENEMQKMFDASNVSKNKQTLLFSATLPKWVKSVAIKRMKAPIETVDLIGEGSVKASTDVTHMCLMCGALF